jgi:hypothetical protein
MAAAAALILVPTVARADVDAGDYTALPAGTNLGLAYYQHATRDRLYSQGNRLPINPGLDSDVGILRGVHFMELGGYVIDPQFCCRWSAEGPGRHVFARLSQRRR